MNVHRIILIEDNPADVRLAEFVIKNMPYQLEIIKFAGGKEFFSYLKNNNLNGIKLILLDLNMPKMSGMQVLKELRASHKFTNTPIVIFTSSTNGKDVAESYKLGANAYVRKPVDLTELEKSLQAVIQFWCEINIGPTV